MHTQEMEIPNHPSTQANILDYCTLIYFLHVTPTVSLFSCILRYPLPLIKSTPNENESLEFHWSKGSCVSSFIGLAC